MGMTAGLLLHGMQTNPQREVRRQAQEVTRPAALLRAEAENAVREEGFFRCGN